ncbi:hypothetical protein VSS74_03465 [Conexibacter stalactiti]|uniref:Protein-S-isoprenylcysteine O-methyltransferase Ste14 n=1 Tax=Conexibacter stalactiti TaxID=1940611 RepID=A0ABU4HJ86_9ACTN|nr:hypothetical protein [Conexibacter stalactiti]MDW5593380.1 hypothetical protein [Conexibacter stalactiti]MEC5034021.1 hypothetical protein [Conexibacter stalactiti]
MRFTDFLKATVMTSAAAATVLAALTAFAASRADDPLLVPFAAGWWILAASVGVVLGRRAETSPPIARLLADARSSQSLPEVSPARVLVNRLWPLLACTVAAGVLALFLPQVAAIAAGFAIIWALSWRQQDAAVTAIEGRDGVRYYVERTSPFRAIQLIRTPGFRSNEVWEMEESATS